MKKKLTLFIFIFLIIPAQIYSFDENQVAGNRDPHELFSQAEEAFKEGNFTDAIDFLMEVIEIDRDFVEAYYLLGKVHKERNNYSEAMKFFERAIDARQAIQKREQAISSIDEIPDPDSSLQSVLDKQREAENIINQAIRQIEKGRFFQAENLIKHAIELNPDIAEYYFRLSDVYLDTNQFEQANLNLRKGLTLDENNVGRFILLAELFAKEGQYREALKTIKDALNFNPGENRRLRPLLQNYSSKVDSEPDIMVIRRDGEEIILNAGLTDGIESGLEFRKHFTIYRDGREIKNPETGEILGVSDEEIIGEVLVTKVEDKLTYGRITRETNDRIRIGDYIKK
ncbi:MAG: tetratricopeptide repeat protein [Candidatus Muiribacteriota bacterium]